MLKRFHDRTEAGKLLAEALRQYADRKDGIVLALPRGGVPVGFEIAAALHLPLDICLVRKLGVPGQPELAMGAIASNGVRILNWDVIRSHRVSRLALAKTTIAELRELERRNRVYRGDRPLPELHGKTVILVDDGLATGATMRAAIAIVKQQHPAAIVVAVPLAPIETCNVVQSTVDQVECLLTPDPFYSLGTWYDHFEQLSDADVQEFMDTAAAFSP
jgi:putative phosphoribosyl transferase